MQRAISVLALRMSTFIRDLNNHGFVSTLGGVADATSWDAARGALKIEISTPTG
jgi:hypothetical protein